MNLKVQVIKEIFLSFYNFVGSQWIYQWSVAKSSEKLQTYPRWYSKRHCECNCTWNIQSHHQGSWQWVLFNISWWVTWYLNERANGLVLRYVNKKWIIIEWFLDIVHVASTIALSLKYAIECLLCEHNLSLLKVHGQGYDGAS